MIKKIFHSSLLVLSLAVFLTSCESTAGTTASSTPAPAPQAPAASEKAEKEVSTAPAKVTPQPYVSVVALDTEECKLKKQFSLEPGMHTLEIWYEKYGLEEHISSVESFTKTFYFESGKEYTIKAMKDSRNLTISFPIREVGVTPVGGIKQGYKAMPDPENGQNIDYLRCYPNGREFEVLGEYSFTVCVAGKYADTATPERTMLYLKDFVTKYNVDALIDPCVTRVNNGFTANAIGIRYTDDGPTADSNEKDLVINVGKPKAKLPAFSLDKDAMAATLAYTNAVLNNTMEGSSKKVMILSSMVTIEYLPDMCASVILLNPDTNKQETKTGHIGFYADLTTGGAGYIYVKFDEGTLTKAQFLDMKYDDADIIWKIVKCDEQMLTVEYVKPEEKKEITDIFMIMVKD